MCVSVYVINRSINVYVRILVLEHVCVRARAYWPVLYNASQSVQRLHFPIQKGSILRFQLRGTNGKHTCLRVEQKEEMNEEEEKVFREAEI
jgi:hypothetical protein